jgi:hypothetical protein
MENGELTLMFFSDYIVRKQGNGKTLCDREVEKIPTGNHHPRYHATDAVGQRTRGFGFVDAAVKPP